MGINSGIGIGIGIPFLSKNKDSGEYISPELKEALCGIWIADQNTNESPTRNIIKNKLSDRGGDFEILNAAYDSNSGYGIIATNFKNYSKDWGEFKGIELTQTSFIVKNNNRYSLIFKRSSPNAVDIEGYEVDIVISKTENAKKSISYYYYDEQGNRLALIINKSGRLNVPKNYISKGTNWIGWYVEPNVICSITQVPKYQGAFVTDGVDDLIVSQKSVSDMLGGSNEVTVVSMMANLGASTMLCNSALSDTAAYNVRNTLQANGVTSILGYSDKSSSSASSIINTIMGDKNSIKLEDRINYNTNRPFYPISYPSYFYKSAWYWTLIAKRVLTTDEINQVIAYYNLDKHVAPDIYYDVKKQGLTNENHAEFGDKLIDYSGNGHDMQLYNFGWKLDSGIGKYEEDFTNRTAWLPYNGVIATPTKISLNSNFNANNAWIIYKPKDQILSTFKVNISGIPNGGELEFYSAINIIPLNNGENNIELNGTSTVSSGFRVIKGHDLDWSNLVIEQIPSFEGALVSDGVEDYGKVEGLPIYKDYTVIADRDWISKNHSSNLAFKGYATTFGSYAFEMYELSDKTWSFNFGNAIEFVTNNISYQTKYSYNGNQIFAGGNADGDIMYLGRSRNAYPYYANAAIRSLMSFPYSLSEFLIERQLKKRKLGTLYPDMVEFRPIVKTNIPISNIQF